MPAQISLTGTLFTIKKAQEICNHLNKEDAGKYQYAISRASKDSAAVEIFDKDGYSLGFL